LEIFFKKQYQNPKRSGYSDIEMYVVICSFRCVSISIISIKWRSMIGSLSYQFFCFTKVLETATITAGVAFIAQW